MDNEYLSVVVQKYNADPNDASLNEAERALLAKLAGVERNWAELAKQGAELEKELNQKTQTLSDVRAKMVREKGRSDAFVEALLVLRK